MAMRRGYFRGFRRERDLSVYSQAYLNKVARQLNERQDLGIRNPSRDLTPVLRRPVETTANSGPWTYLIGSTSNNPSAVMTAS